MTTLLAACGLDCKLCDAYIATQSNDEAAKERILAKWRVEYNVPDMPIAAVSCDGCMTAGGRAGGYCSECKVRACVQEKGLENCASCPDYACNILTGLWQMAPQAKANLDALRSS